MNYSKNTLSPIADAARFFHEKKNNIRYEEQPMLKKGEKNGFRNPMASFSASSFKPKSGLLKMEHH